MADNNKVEVLIDGKVYRMSGGDDADYMRRVAAYINDKMQACRKLDIFRHLDLNTRAVLIHLNIANELFETKDQIDGLNGQIADMEGQLYDVKHDLVTCQLENETLKKQLAQLQEANKNLRRQLAAEGENASVSQTTVQDAPEQGEWNRTETAAVSDGNTSDGSSSVDGKQAASMQKQNAAGGSSRNSSSRNGSGRKSADRR